MKPLLPILLLLVTLPGAAQQEPTYRIVHPDGSVEFTDEPRPGAEEYQIREPTIFTSPPPVEPPAAGEAGPRALSGYERLEITAPAPEATIRDSLGNLRVAVNLAPALEEEHQLVILVDGEVRASGRAESYLLTGIHRGAHVVTAQVRNSAGRVVISSSPVTFHVHQPSVLYIEPAPGS